MSISRIVYALLLSLPVMLFYGWHYVGGPEDTVATGFVQMDMPSYLANGRQYLDGESSGLFYANPYIFDNNDRIYFQPHIALFGGLCSLTPDAPGLPFVLFGLLVTVAGFWVLIGFVRDLCPGVTARQHGFLALIVAWGGGLLCLVGAYVTWRMGLPITPLYLDPSHGYWFLNFGRNFVYPTEALYHLLVLLIFWSLLRQRHGWALMLATLLALCHPFTGIQYGIILFMWVGIELLYVRSGLFKARSAWLFAIPLLFCVVYNKFLMSFETHRGLVDQWMLDWNYKFITIVPAYCLVFILFAARCWGPEKLKACFASPFNRLMGIAAFLSFAMANHEAFFTPHQPIHFTRGHVWLPLCLLGLPLIPKVWARLKPRRVLAWSVAALFTLVMLNDNAIFFAVQMQKPLGLHVTQSQLDAFAYLRGRDDRPVVLSDDTMFAYLSATYSQARPYYGHHFNTTDADRKIETVEQFFDDGTIPEPLESLAFLVLTRDAIKQLNMDVRFEKVHSSGDAAVYRHKVAP